MAQTGMIVLSSSVLRSAAGDGTGDKIRLRCIRASDGYDSDVTYECVEPGSSAQPGNVAVEISDPAPLFAGSDIEGAIWLTQGPANVTHYAVSPQSDSQTPVTTITITVQTGWTCLVLTDTDISDARIEATLSVSSATFDPTLPTLLDHIRLALGDIHENAVAGSVNEALLTDAVITAMLDSHGYLEALAQLAESLAARFAQMPDEFSETGGLKMSWTERVKGWVDLAARARTGKILVPGVKRGTRYGIAVDQTTAQKSLTAPGTTGFRSD